MSGDLLPSGDPLEERVAGGLLSQIGRYDGLVGSVETISSTKSKFSNGRLWPTLITSM